MGMLIVNIQSYTDIITNSSTEIFTMQHVKGLENDIKEIITALFPEWENYYFLANVHNVSKFVLEDMIVPGIDFGGYKFHRYLTEDIVTEVSELYMSDEVDSSERSQVPDRGIKLIRDHLIENYPNLIFIVAREENQVPYEVSNKFEKSLNEIFNSVSKTRLETYWDSLYENNNLENI